MMWLLLLVAAASQPPRRLSLARGDPPPHAAISWPSNGAVGWPSAAVPGVVPVVEPLAPNEVTDVCGGYPGHTKLNEVGQDCAAWTVETLRCMQVCHNTNRLQGFGQCMTDCGVYNPATPPLNEDPPEEGWPTPEEAQNAFCSVGVVNVNVSNVCLHAVKKLQKCNCTLPESTPMPEDYMNCLNTCVFECNKALSLQLRLGTPIGWKPRSARATSSVAPRTRRARSCRRAVPLTRRAAWRWSVARPSAAAASIASATTRSAARTTRR